VSIRTFHCSAILTTRDKGEGSAPAIDVFIKKGGPDLGIEAVVPPKKSTLRMPRCLLSEDDRLFSPVAEQRRRGGPSRGGDLAQPRVRIDHHTTKPSDMRRRYAPRGVAPGTTVRRA
jgi:hypothetical protein